MSTNVQRKILTYSHRLARHCPIFVLSPAQCHPTCLHAQKRYIAFQKTRVYGCGRVKLFLQPFPMSTQCPVPFQDPLASETLSANLLHITSNVPCSSSFLTLPPFPGPLLAPRRSIVFCKMVATTQYFTVPHLFLQESGHSSGIPVESTGIPVESCRNPLIPVEFHWNKTGI